MDKLGETPYGHINRIIWEERSVLKDAVDVLLQDASLVGVAVGFQEEAIESPCRSTTCWLSPLNPLRFPLHLLP
jgi:hypothetical protein